MRNLFVLQACARDKTSKNAVSALQNWPWTVQNQTRSVPERPKNDQHEQQKPNKGSRGSQERKRNAQEQKMCQHSAKLAGFRVPFWTTPPPPSKDMQYVKAGKKCSGV